MIISKRIFFNNILINFHVLDRIRSAKREAGENPARTRHCECGAMFKSRREDYLHPRVSDGHSLNEGEGEHSDEAESGDLHGDLACQRDI